MPYERKELIEKLEEAIEAARLHRSCLTCQHFIERTEQCTKAGGKRPPARTIAMGCPAWYEQVPF